MNILKKENWWIWLILAFVSEGISTFILGALLGVFKKDAWYANWKYWLIGVLCFAFPAAIMFAIFSVQITCETASALGVKGKEYYLSPYIWILCIIIPILGWLVLAIMSIYLQVMIIVELYRGSAEKYIN